MKLLSKIEEIGPLMFPPFGGDQAYMEPLELGNPSLSSSLARWEGTLKAALAHSPISSGRAFVTIDERVVEAGSSHRRGGPHTDGNYVYGWTSGGWLTGENGRVLARDKHLEQYCSPTGGMLIASSAPGCRAWVGEFEGEPGQGGNCAHLGQQLEKMTSFILKPGVLYRANSTCIHESLPMAEKVRRTLLRITLPATAVV